MPTVPQLQTFRVGAGGLPSPGLGAPRSDAGRIAGEQMQQVGQGVQQLGAAGAAIFTDMQQKANALRVDDALNQARERALTLERDEKAGFRSQLGIAALERDSGQPLTEEYGGKLDEGIAEIAKGLGNDAQRQAFMQRAAALSGSFREQAMAHEANEYRSYNLSVREGTIALATNEVAARYDNPEAVQQSILSIQAAVEEQARLLGKSATWAQARALEMTSLAHRGALEAAIATDNLEYADAYLKRFAGEMNADTLLRARGLITKELDLRVASAAVEDVMSQTVPQLETGDADRAWNITVKTESGGRQFASNGVPLRSSAGATGIAQVMPATGPEAARLAGLPWDPKRFETDAKYNEAIGKAYFVKQLRDNGGDIQRAWAAYNAGPKRLADAVAKAGPGGDWLALMPKETRDYVARNTAEYGAGAGAFKEPTLADVIGRLREDPRLAGNPSRLRVAEQEATRRFELERSAKKQRQEDALTDAYRALVVNGGDFSALPINVRADLPPDKLDTLLTFAEKIAGGQDTKTDAALYQRLASDPAYLQSLTESQFLAMRPHLTEGDFKKFADARKPPKGPESDPGNIPADRINRVLNDRLAQLQIDPTPPDKDKTEQARVGTIRKWVREDILAAQMRMGRPMTDAEVEVHIDGLFAKSVEFRTSRLGITTGTTRIPVAALKYADIPKDRREAIRQAFKANGYPEPSDAQVLGAYMRSKAR